MRIKNCPPPCLNFEIRQTAGRDGKRKSACQSALAGKRRLRQKGRVSEEIIDEPAEQPAEVPVTFADLGLSEAVLAGVNKAGYERPTGIQAQAIPVILTGRDVIGSSQTGSGKTAAFALPILSMLGRSGQTARADPGARA